MKFQKKKQIKRIRGILSQYLDGTEKEFREASEIIAEIIEAEHIAKEYFRRQRDRMIIKINKGNG